MIPPPWLIVGQGLAGTCLAWQMWWRQLPFRLIDDDRGGSSRVAAGLINPVTGRNFEPTKGIAKSLPEAVDFYRRIEATLGTTFWHPLPILRLADSEREWQKIDTKRHRPDIANWIDPTPRAVSDGWHGAVVLQGGGRLDTRHFLDSSREFFSRHGRFAAESWDGSSPPESTILCDGAAGLITGRCGTHRCAKGEILTLRADIPPGEIRIGAGGWVVPTHSGQCKAGATYSWEPLDLEPTADGLHKVRAIAERLIDGDFEVIGHDAGIRPILRRSEPLVGPLPGGPWIFNGLGSKGSLQAPATARILTDWLADGQTPDPTTDIRHFLAID